MLLLATPLPATADDPGLVVYWGRHKEEGSLREACDTGHYTTVIITFYNGRYSLDISGHSLAVVGTDIKHCQSRGIIVLLSIGGQGGGYFLPTNASAADIADNLWNTYLGGPAPACTSPSAATRRWRASTSSSTRTAPTTTMTSPGCSTATTSTTTTSPYKFNVLVSFAVSATTLHISSVSLSSPAHHHARDDVAGKAHQRGVDVDVLAVGGTLAE
uniref:GH18 domain-containing protein n=1 Tax=Oryza meridionalis TaxID=40149 RepID=A0A0E0DNE9_9ORYZ